GPAFASGARPSVFNEPISPLRHLAMVSRPHGEVPQIKQRYRTALNDVLLAALPGDVRRVLVPQGGPPVVSRATLPLSGRGADADRHALSIGVTRIQDRACFGLYADRHSLPDADLRARDLDRAIEELLLRSSGNGRSTARPSTRQPITSPS